MNWITLIYVAAWLVTGILVLIITARVDPEGEELIEENEYLLVLGIIIWPVMLLTLTITLVGKSQEYFNLIMKIYDKVREVI